MAHGTTHASASAAAARQRRKRLSTELSLSSVGDCVKPEGCYDFLRAAHLADAGEDALDGVGVALRAHARHGIASENLLVAALVSVAGGAFDSELGGDATQDNGRNA